MIRTLLSRTRAHRAHRKHERQAPTPTTFDRILAGEPVWADHPQYDAQVAKHEAAGLEVPAGVTA